MGGVEGKRGGQAFMDRLRYKYRLSISNSETYQEVWGMRLSRLNFLVALGSLMLLVLLLTWAVIFFTPVREFIPGYANSAVTQQVVANALRADSLDREIELWGNYLANLRIIMSGGVPESYLQEQDTVSSLGPVQITRSEEDSLLRVQMEQDWRQGATPSRLSGTLSELRSLLVKPVDGIVSGSYNLSEGHLGTDIVGESQAPIGSVADGIVVLTTWELEQGHVIVVQHFNGLMSVYKHNHTLLKRMGDHVRAGDVIALMGNTGQLSTGPHLHLELWFQGRSLNAEDYIAFK